MSATAPVSLDEQSTGEDSLLRNMVEAMPLNVMLTNLDFEIVYVNAASRRTLDGLAEHLPIDPDDIVGSSIDVFHKHPEHQRRMLADPGNLPHVARVRLGPEWLRLHVAAIYDPGGAYVGPMVTWDVITEQVATEAQKKALQAQQEADRKELQEKVDQLVASIESAVGGDLTVDVPVRGTDPVGRLGEGLASLLGAFREGIAATAETAEQLGAAAESVSLTAEELGDGVRSTQEQADSLSTASDEVDGHVQAVASAAEEMSASIGEIARSASQASQVAGDGVQKAQDADTIVSSLGQASDEIGEVLKVISSIAQQTNLLALNATIEAARAGEAGKGFAVVANEVKELAKETARATEDIGRKIEAIQGNTGQAVAAIRAIGEVIRQISAIQDEIASAVEEQSAVTSEISRSAGTAASSTSLIASGAREVAGTARDGRSATEMMGVAAKELAGMAKTLQGHTNRFTT